MKNKSRMFALGLLLFMGIGSVLLSGFRVDGLPLLRNLAADQAPMTTASMTTDSLAQSAHNVITQAATAQSGAAEVAGAYSGGVELQVVVAGTYSDTLPTETITETPDLGLIDLALQISQTSSVLSGYVMLDKTMVFSVEHTIQVDGAALEIGPYVNGSFDGTALTLLSERVSTNLNGKAIERQFWLSGTISAGDGSRLVGQYRETMWGVARQPVTVIGDFTMQRPVFGNSVQEPTNQAPQTVADEVSAEKEKPVTINVLNNDSDANGDALTITEVSKPQFGTATTDGQTITYTPSAGFEGTDTFTYLVSDGKGGESAGSVTITVGTNQAPTAGADSATTPSGTVVIINVGANDSDPDGDTLTIIIDGPPSNGTATVENGQIVYTP
ncbi:MAG TPA: cadherin-like domain-containing protein, partial [Caldilineaceae bacterium]|nr:cadherin-like domain-containing protein [Caldilineaceae bacterium]